MELQLRDYQEKVRADLYDQIRSGHKRICLTAGTGAGKTEMASAISQDSVSKGRSVWFLVHRDNLVRQTVARFQKYGIEPGVIKSGFPESLDSPIQVASVQTLQRRKRLEEFLMDSKAAIFWDEAHVTAFSTLGKRVIGLQRPNHIHIGLTATPRRLSKREGFRDLFDAQVMAPVPGDLMKRGFLVPPRYFGLPKLDLKGVRTTGGEWNAADLGVIVNDPEVITNATDNWVKLGDNRPTIGFTVNVSHAHAMADEFNRRGIPAAAVDGSMDPVTEREPIYRDLAEGRIKAVFSCEALAEGFDCPIVGCVMLLRPTKSWAKYLQQLGRGLRTAEGKTDCIVLDQSGNVSRFGFVEELTEVDMMMDSGSDGATGDAPVKECPACQALVRTFATVCPHCGFIFEKGDKEIASGTLVDLKAGAIPPPIQLDSWGEDARFYRAARAEAYKKRKSPGWAMVTYKERFGQDKWPKAAEWSKGAVFGLYPTAADRRDYLKYLGKCAENPRNPHDKAWVDREYAREFGENPTQLSLLGPVAPPPALTWYDTMEG